MALSEQFRVLRSRKSENTANKLPSDQTAAIDTPREGQSPLVPSA